MSTLQIPDKMFFKIGEVAKITGVKPYILRYWESEFPHLRPSKGRSQHRLYRRKDVEDILRIKGLLYDEKFTIAGAKKMLRMESETPVQNTHVTGPSNQQANAAGNATKAVREELLALRALVSRL